MLALRARAPNRRRVVAEADVCRAPIAIACVLRRAPAREGVRHPRPADHVRHPAEVPRARRAAAHVGKFYFRPPGGESWCDVILRLRSLIEMITRE